MFTFQESQVVAVTPGERLLTGSDLARVGGAMGKLVPPRSLVFALCSFDPKNLWICLNSCPPGFSFSSNTITFIPRFAASTAADRPDGPAPTTIRSYLSISSVPFL